MVIEEFKLYDLLKARIGESEAGALFELLDKKVDSKFLDGKNSIIAEINSRIASLKADLIKWMFIFWIGRIAAMFGFILLYEPLPTLLISAPNFLNLSSIF